MGKRHQSPAGTFIQPVTLTDKSGSYIDLGPSNDSSDAFNVYNSSAYESGSIISGSAVTLYNLKGYNSGSATYVQVHNVTGSVLIGNTPIIIVKADADDNFSWEGGRFGVPFSTGISVVNSNVANTFAGTGSADCWFNVLYK